MAKINKNLLVRGARGHMGRQFVYRKHGNDTLMTRMPEVNPDQVPTDEQTRVRDLFTEAAVYAKGAIADPELKTEYRKKAKPGRTAFNIAFRDYLKAPVVQSINVTRYTGVPGSTIEVSAKDDFRVVAVSVSIYNDVGTLLEQGNAVLNPVNRNKWVYTATVPNAALAGAIVRAIALDLPGNAGELEVIL